jgi:hypothetical protein
LQWPSVVEGALIASQRGPANQGATVCGCTGMRESAAGTAGVASVGRSRMPVVANRRLKRAASLSLRKALFGRLEVDKFGEAQAGDRAAPVPGR